MARQVWRGGGKNRAGEREREYQGLRISQAIRAPRLSLSVVWDPGYWESDWGPCCQKGFLEGSWLFCLLGGKAYLFTDDEKGSLMTIFTFLSFYFSFRWWQHKYYTAIVNIA